MLSSPAVSQRTRLSSRRATRKRKSVVLRYSTASSPNPTTRSYRSVFALGLRLLLLRVWVLDAPPFTTPECSNGTRCSCYVPHDRCTTGQQIPTPRQETHSLFAFLLPPVRDISLSRCATKGSFYASNAKSTRDRWCVYALYASEPYPSGLVIYKSTGHAS